MPGDDALPPLAKPLLSWFATHWSSLLGVETSLAGPKCIYGRDDLMPTRSVLLQVNCQLNMQETALAGGQQYYFQS
jgi:hypothetical protein